MSNHYTDHGIVSPNLNVYYLLSRVVYLMFVLYEIHNQQKQIGVSTT